MLPRIRPALPALCAAAALLAGCAAPDPDAGFAAVEQRTRERIGKDLLRADDDAAQDRVAQRVADLLAQPLDADAAVQLALLNNRGLQAGFQALDIGAAERVQAARLPNPGLRIGRLGSGASVETDIGLHFSLARLLALPLTGPLEDLRLRQTRELVALRVLALAADTRRAHVLALAAAESLRYQQQVLQAAQAGAELATRMARVGNFNRLQQAREQGFAAEAALDLARAEQAARAARERLVRLLGLWGGQTGFTLPERLPDLPAAPLDLPELERSALAQRLDVQGARLAAQQTAQQLGLTRSTRFVNLLELGLLQQRGGDAPTRNGWELGIELPLFDSGDARLARAEALYRQALHQAAETAVNARSELREAYGAYRSAYDIARHHQQVLVPLRQQISEQNLLRYNGMLIGVFELLADARSQITSVRAAIEARRDFWLAQADLDAALIGRPGAGAVGAAGAGTGTATRAAAETPQANGAH